MITPFWPDQKWFPDFICLAIEPPRRAQTITVASMDCNNSRSNSKVMKSIQLTAGKLTSQSVPRVASQKKMPGKSLTPGQRNQAELPEDI